jgi:heme-degrading monooxygenase HmoA
MLKPELLPGLSRVPGFVRSYLLRRERDDDVEFITLILFDSLESLRQFAGPDYERSIVPEDRKHLLKQHDNFALHYEVASVCEAIANGANPATR